MQPEEVLIRQCLEGDRAALDTLYLQFSSKMFAICLRYSFDRMEAEDLLQEGFIKVYDRLSKFNGKGSFEGWMRKIFVNLSIDYYHKKRKERERLKDFKVEFESNVDNTEESDWPDLGQEELIQLIQQLPDGYRIVFNLFAIELYSHKEIAVLLGVSESTSKTQYFKARRMLKAKIYAIINLKHQEQQ